MTVKEKKKYGWIGNHYKFQEWLNEATEMFPCIKDMTEEQIGAMLMYAYMRERQTKTEMLADKIL